MDQIATVKLGAVGAGEHERTAPSLPSRSGYLVNQYQFNSQILSPAARIIARLHVWTHLSPNFPARAGPPFSSLCTHMHQHEVALSRNKSRGTNVCESGGATVE